MPWNKRELKKLYQNKFGDQKLIMVSNQLPMHTVTKMKR